MKKLLVLFLFVCLVSINISCGGGEAECEMKNTTNCIKTKPEPINGLSEIIINIPANPYNGLTADVKIWAGQNRKEKIVDDQITVKNGGQFFSYLLEPGDYEINIIGQGFTSYKYFYLSPNDPNDAETLIIELLDAYTVEWVIDYRDDTPTTGTVSPETHLLWFEVSQNWLKALDLYGMSLHVENPGNAVTIETCKIQQYSLAGWTDVSSSVTSPDGYNFYFEVGTQTLDPYLSIQPYTPNSHIFALSCDISYAQPGAKVKAYHLGFGFLNSYLLPFEINYDTDLPEITF